VDGPPFFYGDFNMLITKRSQNHRHLKQAGSSEYLRTGLRFGIVSKNANRKFRLLALAVISLMVTFTIGAVNQSAPPKHTPFVSVVLRDFDSWDTNHDGVLSADEIDRVVVDPAVKGEDAAAAGALKLLSRSKKNPLPPLTKPYFSEYDRLALQLMSHRSPEGGPTDAITATVDTVASASTTQPAARSRHLPVDFDLYFSAGKERIARGGPVPFTGRFVLDDTRQGPLGDCFFVSSVSSLGFHDPSRFEKLIVPQKGGGYVVHLPTTNPIIVPPPTDAELAISSTTTGDGVWLAIMEQAFGKYRARLHGSATDDVEGTELIRTGGDSMPTIRSLTGHECMRISFGKTVEFRKANADKILPKLRKELVSALSEHRVITAGIAGRAVSTTAAEHVTGTIPPLPADISSNHVYAVLSYDPASDVVEIWNPHGQHFVSPRARPGLSMVTRPNMADSSSRSLRLSSSIPRSHSSCPPRQSRRLISDWI
jgi:hypothetical protein